MTDDDAGAVRPDRAESAEAAADAVVDDAVVETPVAGRSADGSDAADGADEPRKKHRRGSVLREVAVIVVVALVVSALVRAFLFQAFYIPSGSMENTLLINDRVIVNKIGTDLGSINRGDVVVFQDPGGWLGPQQQAVRQGNALQRGVHRALELVGLAPSPADQDVIKRVIGVGGDRVACCTDGKVTVNGVPLDEPYVYPGNVPSDMEFDVTVPEGRLFVMGDHRNDSNDSRVQGRTDDEFQGTIPVDSVVGRAVLVVWPLDRWGTLDHPDTFDDPALDAGK